MSRGRKFVNRDAQKLRDHVAREHTDWAPFADDLSDELVKSYHRSDHIYCTSKREEKTRHRHPDVSRGQ